MLTMAAEFSRYAGVPDPTPVAGLEGPAGGAVAPGGGGIGPAGGTAATDGELARLARAGDRGAFARLYERFAPAVHGVLVANAPFGEARDLVQEVFLLALRAIRGLDEPEKVGPWLCAIARNRARDAHKRRRDGGGDERVPEPAVEDVARGEEEEEAARVLEVLRSLPESYRETLALRLVEGLSGPEIAERTGMTHGSVRVNLHRGIKLLREEIERARGGGA